jgi:signal transduction histidine kinase
VATRAAASTVTIDVVRHDDWPGVTIADDGVGDADPTRGSGLTGLTDRVEGLDGGSVNLTV